MDSIAKLDNLIAQADRVISKMKNMEESREMLSEDIPEVDMSNNNIINEEE